jgi:cytolysin-activating lysine-acyltransferase
MLTVETGANCVSQELKAPPREVNGASVIQRNSVNQQVALAQIITLMLGSAPYRNFAISDLEWMVLPALRLGQIAVADSQLDQSGMRHPVAVVIWASVSSEVDKRISSNLSAPIRLRPDEWRSGDILWVSDIIGDPRAGHALVRNVLNTTLAGRTVRVRSLSSDGSPALLEVSASTVSVITTNSPATCNSSAPCHTGTLCASCVTTGCKGHCRSVTGAAANH